jgi:hypothetical protein
MICVNIIPLWSFEPSPFPVNFAQTLDGRRTRFDFQASWQSGRFNFRVSGQSGRFNFRVSDQSGRFNFRVSGQSGRFNFRVAVGLASGMNFIHRLIVSGWQQTVGLASGSA